MVVCANEAVGSNYSVQTSTVRSMECTFKGMLEIVYK
jgi:hypothetical protein